MNIGVIVATILRNDAEVNALISGRVYPVRAPQLAAFPCAVYNLVKVTPAMHKGGPATSDLCEVDISLWGKDFDALMTLGWKVRMAVDSFDGVIGDDNIPGAHFVSAVTWADEESEMVSIILKFNIRVNWG